MMKILNRRVLLGVILVLLSVIFYLLHYLIFKDPHHIFLYLIGDIAAVNTNPFDSAASWLKRWSAKIHQSLPSLEATESVSKLKKETVYKN